MAYYTETIRTQAKLSMPRAILAAVGRGFARVFDAQNRSHDVRRMQDLSDAQLAKMGVRREDIVRYVYRDIFYV